MHFLNCSYKYCADMKTSFLKSSPYLIAELFWLNMLFGIFSEYIFRNYAIVLLFGKSGGSARCVWAVSKPCAWKFKFQLEYNNNFVTFYLHLKLSYHVLFIFNNYCKFLWNVITNFNCYQKSGHKDNDHMLYHYMTHPALLSTIS